MATMGEYYRQLRQQGYSAAAARDRARQWRERDINEREAEMQRQQEALDYEYDQEEPEPEPFYRPDELYWGDYKDPTNTMFPDRPRSNRARYDDIHQVIAIDWARPGRLGPTTYYRNASRQTWENMKQAPSTGRYVNAVLNYHEYDYDDRP